MGLDYTINRETANNLPLRLTRCLASPQGAQDSARRMWPYITNQKYRMHFQPPAGAEPSRCTLSW